MSNYSKLGKKKIYIYIYKYLFNLYLLLDTEIIYIKS